MSWLEWTGAILALANVALAARRNLWNFAFGIAASAIYFFIFRQAGLYSGALLQIFFILLQTYGWWNWRRFLDRDELPVERMNGQGRWLWLLGSLGLAMLWGGFMSIATDARLPFADAMLSIGSVASQALCALRRVEGWMVWVGVNLGAIALFASQELFATTALYVVLLALSVMGLRSWSIAAR